MSIMLTSRMTSRSGAFMPRLMLQLRTWTSRPSTGSSAPGHFGHSWNWTTFLSRQRRWTCTSSSTQITQGCFRQPVRLPIFLHSCGSATSKCPCDCRAGSFTHDWLSRDGLRGVVLFTDEGFRFLHPQEVSLLLCLPLDLLLLPDLRASLCLLGQVASSLQSIWLMGHMRQILEIVCTQPRGFSAAQLLAQYKESFQFQQHHLWAVHPSFLTRHWDPHQEQASNLLVMDFRRLMPCSVQKIQLGLRPLR